jgi:two-component system sensor histidine kinase KdpD
LNFPRIPRSAIVGYLAAMAGVALMTWLIGLVRAHARIANISSLYLIVVLAVAATFGGGPAVAASVLAFLMFDWFFVNPVGYFTVSDPEEWLALVLFLVTAVVTSQLAAAQRRRAAEAQRREQETMALYTLSSLIAQDSNPTRFIPKICNHFASELALVGAAVLVPDRNGRLRPSMLHGVCLDETPAQRAVAEWVLQHGDIVGLGCPRKGLRVLGVPHRPSSVAERQGASDFGSVYVQLRAGQRAVGVLQFVRLPDAPALSAAQRRLLDAAGQQIGMALERSRLSDEAAEAEALRRADEVKSALLSSVSHDLRTPLALIKAAAGSLRQNDVDWTAEEREAFAVAIEQDVDRLDRIVGNLLDISQIEAGTLRPDRQYYPLNALVDDVLGRLRPLLVHHQVTVDVPDDLPPVFVDYVAIDRVLSNLVENVDHHTPAGTAIAISARMDSDSVVVRVADDGPGIPRADLPRIFEKFYRGRQSRRGSFRGSGLGLTVVKGLVEAHGGTVSVENQETAGAIFRFTLPVRRAPDLPTSATDNGSSDPATTVTGVGVTP